MRRQSWWERPAAAVVAAAFLSVSIGASAGHIPAEEGHRAVNAVGVVLGLVGVWSVLLRWVRPYLMVLVAGAAATSYIALNFVNGPALAAAPLSVLTFGFVRSRRELYAAAAAMWVALATAALAVGGWGDYRRALGYLGPLLVAVLAAELLRARRERAEAHRETQRRQQQQTLVEQQLSLARDLHDSVAHALTAVNVQASIAERMARRDPDAAIAAAAAIRETSRAALIDLTDIVRSLRADQDARVTPERGLGDIDALAEQARSGGLRVTVVRDGDGDGEPDLATGAAAYRLVQEALTNATRYAPGSQVRIDIDQRDGLLVRVRDDGGDPSRRGEQVHGSGHGLLGMRERVVATGGTLHHGPCQQTGFEVVGHWSRA